MHEMSIITSVFSIIEKELKDGNKISGQSSVAAIRLIVGKFSNAIPDALMFAFNSAKKGTIFEKSELIIKETPLKCLCKSCGLEFILEKHSFICEGCNSKDLSITSGRELFVESIDIE